MGHERACGMSTRRAKFVTLDKLQPLWTIGGLVWLIMKVSRSSAICRHSKAFSSEVIGPKKFFAEPWDGCPGGYSL